MQHDDISIYKYTIASSKAEEDGKWADEMFGCSFRDVTDTKGCAELGKTSCLGHSMAYGLHFVTNAITPAGDKDVAYWDAYTTGLHGKLEKFNAFMDYRMTFYVPDLTEFAAKVFGEGTDCLLRSSEDKASGATWYSALVMSPSGKMFEVMSTRLTLKAVSDTEAGKRYLAAHGGAVKSWDEETGSCAETQAPHTDLIYSVDELDTWFDAFTTAENGGTYKGFLPVRNNVAVSSLAKTKAFWSSYFPSLHLGHETASGDGTCKSLSTQMQVYTSEAGYKVATRFVENKSGSGVKGDHSVSDFIAYVNSVHAEYTAANKGWDAWYDRHLGLLFQGCSLDGYMAKFFKDDVSFNPHGRDATTLVTDSPTQHCWTEGVEGYGIEMQGFYDFSFRTCYTVFDWCQEDSSGRQFCAGEDTGAQVDTDTDSGDSSVAPA